MNDELIERVVAELDERLTNGVVVRVLQVGRAAFVVAVRAAEQAKNKSTVVDGSRSRRDAELLFISAEPARPRLYLVERVLRELERESLPPTAFAQQLRKQIGAAQLTRIDKDAGERIVRLTFKAEDELGALYERKLIAQLTGRSANLFLADEANRILDRLRVTHGAGQDVGETYQPPAPLASEVAVEPKSHRGLESLTLEGERSISVLLDEHFRSLEAAQRFDARAAAHRTQLDKEIAKRRKLISNLQRDLEMHGAADEHRRIGDLLLANVATAERDGNRTRLTDYYAEGAPTIEVEVGEDASLPEEAARRFARYTKAKRAAEEVSRRLAEIETELAALEDRRAELESVVAARDEARLDELIDSRSSQPRKARTAHRAAGKRAGEAAIGARRYRSSDGFEMLVGRGARDNDQLTFRVARPNDLWLHAADYPGAHVIVRNHTREEVPHRTIVEAAQLAAHASQAKDDAKVAVNYTPRKFISKPKGAAPGLVRLSNFRTLLVEPRESGERILE